jgi:hypothetical protein
MARDAMPERQDMVSGFVSDAGKLRITKHCARGGALEVSGG